METILATCPPFRFGASALRFPPPQVSLDVRRADRPAASFVLPLGRVQMTTIGASGSVCTVYRVRRDSISYRLATRKSVLAFRHRASAKSWALRVAPALHSRASVERLCTRPGLRQTKQDRSHVRTTEAQRTLRRLGELFHMVGNRLCCRTISQAVVRAGLFSVCSVTLWWFCRFLISPVRAMAGSHRSRCSKQSVSCHQPRVRCRMVSMIRPIRK